MKTQLVLRCTLSKGETDAFNRYPKTRTLVAREVTEAARDANAPAHLFSYEGRLLLAFANPNDPSEVIA